MRILLAATLCVFAVGASAQLYRWTDDKGRVHVTDTPPPASAKDVKKSGAAGAATAAPAAAPSAGQEPFAIQQAKAQFPVTLYTVANCAGCDAARRLLNTRGVPFKEISLTGATQPQIEEFQQIVGSNTAPAMVVGTTVQKGFEDSAYQRLLDAAGYPATGIVPPRNQAAPAPSAPSAAALPQVKPAAQPEQPSGPYSPGAPPQPTTKKK